MVGKGLDKFEGEPARYIMEIQTLIHTYEDCNKKLPDHYIDKSQLCAYTPGNAKEDTCSGTSMYT